MRRSFSLNDIDHEFSRFDFVGYTPIYWSPWETNRNVDKIDIRADLAALSKTWNGLITYGSTGVLTEIPSMALELGFERVILGVYDLHNQEEVANAIGLIEQYPNLIRGLCVGNEGLAFDFYSLETLIERVRLFRERFPNLLISTSEPIFSWGNKRLLEELDFCFPIIHPWIHEIFKSDPTAAAMWMVQAAQRLQILSNKVVLVKETGFPGDGCLYSYEQQSLFWETLLKESGAFARHVHLAMFEAFDNPEKITFSAERYWDTCWGMHEANRKPKPVVKVIQKYLGAANGKDERVSFESSEGPVAVVIPTKDRPEYLRESAKSALEQGDALGQLILINDNSEQEAVDRVCRSFCESPKVKYIRLSKPGSSGTARNVGLREVDRPFACFLDDDDVFMPGKLIRQLGLLKANSEIAFTSTSAVVIDENGKSAGRSGSPEFFPKAPMASLLAFCQIVHSSVMVRSEALKEVGGYREFFEGEDWELWCHLISKGYRGRHLEAPLTFYRRHSENISNTAYIRKAVANILSIYLKDSKSLMSPLPWDAHSGDLIRSSILIFHGFYDQALEYLGATPLMAARVARHICYRELGKYTQARKEIEDSATAMGLKEQLNTKLSVHEKRFQNRPNAAVVGSPALVFEQRLLAQDALSTSLDHRYRVDLGRYFHQSPKNINVEYNFSVNSSRKDPIEIDNDLFFKRVSLTSC